ncbi:MAG: LPS-assembly protein LptD [Bacteroidetes bacterium]|nr:LPS-assembly protein LptD [Fibrella sp.]
MTALAQTPKRPPRPTRTTTPTRSTTTPASPTGALSATGVTGSDSTRITAQDTTKADEAFATTVKYSSKDSSRFENATQTMELFGEAEVVYGQISLKADYIRLNYRTNEVYAKGRYDSTTKKTIGTPIFQDGGDKYDAKEIRYNFKSKKGIIQGVITQQGDGNIRGKNVKKDDEDNLYIRGAIYTTCNLTTPHYHINAQKLKVIKNKQVVAGPFNLVINQVPLPIGLPFGFFPFPKKKDIGVSGILIPQYGEEPNGRGYYLRDGGYYFAVSENLGVQLRGSIYSRGSYGVGLSSAYNKRYRYSGSLNLSFARNRLGDPVDTTSTPRNDFSITWAHAPIPHGRGSFSANVNVSSNSYNQFNSLGAQQYISNVAGSSVQYSRTLGQYARAGANIRVNQQFGQINPRTGVRSNGKTDISTDFNFGVNQIAPFALKGGTGRWFESFRVGLDVSGNYAVNNTIRTIFDTTGLGFRVVGRTARSRAQIVSDSLERALLIRNGVINNETADPSLVQFNLANLPRLLRNSQPTIRYSVPISLPNVKLLRFINLTPGFSLQGDVYTKQLNYRYLGGDSVRIDTTKGIFTAYTFAVSASVNTRLYGTYQIRGKRIEAIRHTLAPSVSLSYVPDFSTPGFGIFQTLDIPVGTPLNYLPNFRRRLSRYRGFGGSAGSSAPGQQANISFGIVNQLEMKVRTRDDTTGKEFKKVPLLDNISLNGSYNLLALDGYNLSPIQVSANTQIFKNINFNFSSTFDPYAYRTVPGSYYNPYATTLNGNYWPIPTYVQIAQADSATNNYPRVPQYALLAGQGLARLTNLNFYLSTRLAPKGADKPKKAAGVSDATINAINQNPEMYVDFTIPWSMNISYTLSINKYTPEQSNVVQALTLTGDFSLTPKWKFTFNTGYDFTFRSPSLTTVGINRDLHCWEMAFNWTPYAGNAFRTSTYSFDLRVRSALLQELKLSRRRTDGGGFGSVYR